MIGSICTLVFILGLTCAPCNAQPEDPTGLSATSSKSNELTITWTDTPGATHKVYVGTAAADEANAVDTTNNPFTTSTFSGSSTPLVGNTEYNVAVYAVDATDSTLVSAAISGTGTTVFAAPTLNRPTNPTSSSVDLSWTAPGNGGGAATVTGYTISYTGGGGGTQDVTDPSATSATISPLDSNTAYSFTIAAKSSAGNGDSSTAQPGTTLPDRVVPAANTTTATINTIGLNWIPVSGGVPVTYTVTWISATGGSPMTGISGNSASVSGLTASTQYTFNVVAVNSAGSSADSVSYNSQYSTLPDAPAAPSSSPGSNATNTIVVSWTAPTGGNDIVDYVIEWTAHSATATIVATGTSTTLTSLTPGELYCVNVKARNSAGAGAKSNNTLYSTNLCQLTTCLNGGTCNRLPLNYSCSCLPGYSGRNCETDLCTPNPCANGGGCSRIVGDYKCLCEPGFVGRNCNQARFYSFKNGSELHINKIPTQLTSHEAAETQCNSLQASLAIVKSEEVQIYLNQINQLWLSNVPIWLGGKLTNCTWLWSDGSNMDGYNNLVDQSAPNGDGCLSLTRNGSWFAQNCSTSIGYACERRAETKLMLYIILPICVILIVVGIAVICIRKRSKRGRKAAEVPAVQFAPDPRTVYEEIQSPPEGEYEIMAIRS